MQDSSLSSLPGLLDPPQVLSQILSLALKGGLGDMEPRGHWSLWALGCDLRLERGKR